MAMPTIKQEWDAFIKAVAPGLPSQGVQYIEMRRAFYAGQRSMLTMVQIAADDGDPTDEVGVNRLKKLTEELAEFNERMKRGEA